VDVGDAPRGPTGVDALEGDLAAVVRHLDAPTEGFSCGVRPLLGVAGVDPVGIAMPKIDPCAADRCAVRRGVDQSQGERKGRPRVPSVISVRTKTSSPERSEGMDLRFPRG
jgi:hypothetical protein